MTKYIKLFENFIPEARESDLEGLADLGLGPAQFEWEVEYDEDMQNIEKSDRQEIYDYESPTGAHITRVKGVIEAFQTQLDIYFSNEDKIQMHVKFSQHPGDKGRAAFQVKHNSKWHSVFNPIVSYDKAEEWLQKCEDSGSSVQPIFYYYEEFLKALSNDEDYQIYWTMENQGLNITTNEMMKPDYTRLQLFIRALRDLPIDSNIILKIRQLINNLIIDPYHNRISILTEVDRGFSDIPGISELVAKFSRPLTEAREIEPHEEAELANMKDTVNDINGLIELGLIDDSGYRKEMVAISKAFNKFVKGLNLDLKDQADLDLLKSLGEKAGQDSLMGLSLAGGKALATKGLHLVSSPTQLANGSLIFSVDPNYRRSDGWGIGFFPGPKVIRRMTPTQINLGVWSRTLGSMDIAIKHFRDTTSNLDFYNKAMLWAADNIDFDHAVMYPEKHVWKYYKKKKETRDKRTESDDLRVQADAIMSEVKFSPWQSPIGRLAALEKYIEAWKLRLKAAQLDNNEKAIIDAKDQIAHMELDIANSKNRN